MHFPTRWRPSSALAPPGGRQSALATACATLAARHNARGLTAPVEPSITSYHGRPALVLMAGRFAEACLATVADERLRALPLIGGIDQAVDNTDVLNSPMVYRRLAPLFAALAPDGSTSD